MRLTRSIARMRIRTSYFAPFIYPVMCVYSYLRTDDWHWGRNLIKAGIAILLILIIDHDPAKRKKPRKIVP